jgi:hypothetical protein
MGIGPTCDHCVQLLRAAAHDFNNLLMVIQGDSDLILQRLPDRHTLRRNAEGIRERPLVTTQHTHGDACFSRVPCGGALVLIRRTVSCTLVTPPRRGSRP